MKHRPSIPAALQVVAILFLLYGVGSAVRIFVHLLAGHVHIDFGVLGIPIYFGLRRFSGGWRIVALVFNWAGLIMCPLAFGIVLVSLPSTLMLYGFNIEKMAALWASVICVAGFLLTVWQYRVLTRPDIRALFFAARHPFPDEESSAAAFDFSRSGITGYLATKPDAPTIEGLQQHLFREKDRADDA